MDRSLLLSNEWVLWSLLQLVWVLGATYVAGRDDAWRSEDVFSPSSDRVPKLVRVIVVSVSTLLLVDAWLPALAMLIVWQAASIAVLHELRTIVGHDIMVWRRR